MSDPQRLLDAHHAFMEMSRVWLARFAELREAGKKAEAKEAWANAQDWLDLANRLEQITKKLPPF